MGCYRNSRAWSSQSEGSAWSAQGCGRMNWKLGEITAMVLGFMIFWPIGLAILLAKIWQRQSGAERDLFSFVQEKASRFEESLRPHRSQSGFSGWGSSGNSAFDEWRESELARLEEERRKLADAEREFADHIEQLRRARDREEFESFMRARKGGAGA
jgi:hypothetical protein